MMATKNTDNEKKPDTPHEDQGDQANERKKSPMAGWLKDKLQTKKNKVKEEDPNIYPLF